MNRILTSDLSVLRDSQTGGEQSANRPSSPKMKDWAVVPFDRFAVLQRGHDLTKSQFRPGEVPVAGSNGIIGLHNVANVPAPGVTVGRSGSVGRVSIYDKPFWAHNTCLYVRNFCGNNAKYTYYVLQHLDLGRFKSGASVPTLDRNTFRTVPVAVPPLEEQQQIATVLSEVQRAIERQERLIALTTELKKALMHKLFTEGTRGEPLKQSEIGAVPESWRAVSIREECIDCAFGPRFSSKEYVLDGTITTLRTTDMDDDGHIDYTHAPRANLDPTRFASHFLKTGDIVVSRSGTCGITSVFEGYTQPVLPGAFLIRLRMRDAVWPQYLRHYLNSPQGRARTALIAEGAIQKNISGTRLQDFIIPLPPRGEQVAIARAIDNIARVGAVNQQRKRALEGLFRTLLHQLMTAQIRVHDLDLSALEEAEREPGGAV